MSERIHIIGFGNPLHGDDGFGPAVCAALRQQSWPAQVAIFDAGVRGIDALDCFVGCDRAIVVDALVGAMPLGQLHQLSATALLPEVSSLSLHGAGLGHLLSLLPLALDVLPELEILAASSEPPTPFRLSLSPASQGAVPLAVAWIAERIGQLCHGQN